MIDEGLSFYNLAKISIKSKNYNNYLENLHKSSDCNYKIAINELGNYYIEIDDLIKAKPILEKGHKLKITNCSYQLSKVYLSENNTKKTIELLEESADKGHIRAQKTLMFHYVGDKLFDKYFEQYKKKEKDNNEIIFFMSLKKLFSLDSKKQKVLVKNIISKSIIALIKIAECLYRANNMKSFYYYMLKILSHPDLNKLNCDEKELYQRMTNMKSALFFIF